jgi:hypothetical protein
VPSGLKRLILWDYPRGVWQYDVVCAAILAFLIFTPREWFRDQPRIPHSNQIASLPGHGEAMFWIEPELVSQVPEANRLAALSKILTQRTGKTQKLTRIEPIVDSEKELKGYMAFGAQ